MLKAEPTIQIIAIISSNKSVFIRLIRLIRLIRVSIKTCVPTLGGEGYPWR